MSTDSGAPPAIPSNPDPLAGLRFYPIFAVVVAGGFVAVTALTSTFVTHRFVDQVLVPRVRSVDLRPGDVVEVGSSGKYRPVLVRHADGSVTDAGELPHYLRFLRGLLSFLATALVWFPCVWLLARWWPKRTALGSESPDAEGMPAVPPPGENSGR